MYVRKRKQKKAMEKVLLSLLQDPKVSNSREIQNPKGRKLPSKYVEKEKG